MSAMETDEIRSEQQGALGIITLTRPKALNALTLGMIRVMDPLLRRWSTDPSIGAVLVRGEGDRAFCAGGDVRAVYDSGMAQRRGEGGTIVDSKVAPNPPDSTHGAPSFTSFRSRTPPRWWCVCRMSSHPSAAACGSVPSIVQ